MAMESFSRNNIATRILKNAQLEHGEAVLSVNDVLFQQIYAAEKHAHQIIEKGQLGYIDGIKANVFDKVDLWLKNENDNVFTLYGNMGSGKSFFSAKLFQKTQEENTLCDSVAFSSQQTYYDTTKLQNVLISVAHQLFERVSVCREHFLDISLNTDSVYSLVESVLIAPFESVNLERKVLIIIDGLDEYPKQECEAFLEALARLRYRFNPRVKIFFSSRPEPYIISQTICESDNCVYYIEKNRENSYADCANFIAEKCDRAYIKIDIEMREQLIEKSEHSLKYLDCFFNDISCNPIINTADFIASLPAGLHHYYRDQLLRYFGDESLNYYQTKIVPLLEILCVAKRPLTIDEAADILGCRESDINSIVSRSGTLLYKNSRKEVRLYQSESIREFLMDDSCCPEKYCVDKENGISCIVDRLKEVMDNGEDIESNTYIFKYSVDHIFDHAKLISDDYALLIKVFVHFINKGDIVARAIRRLLERSASEIRNFFIRMYSEDNSDDLLLSDMFSVRVAAVIVNEKEFAEKLFDIFDTLLPAENYDFLISYCHSRYNRSIGKNQEAETLLKPYLAISDKEDIRTVFRHSLYVDEICRIYRAKKDFPRDENTRLHVLSIEEGRWVCSQYEQKDRPSYLAILRNISVSFNQLAKLCEQIEGEMNGNLRESCADILQSVLRIPAAEPTEQGYFLLAAEAAYKENLRLIKICQHADFLSDARAHDMYLSFYNLGKLFDKTIFPKYNPKQALLYYIDGLSSVYELANDKRSNVKFVRAAYKCCVGIINFFIKEKAFDEARDYLTRCVNMLDSNLLNRRDKNLEYYRYYCEKMKADLINTERGIEAAEEYYLNALQLYKEFCKGSNDEKTLSRPEGIYLILKDGFRKIGNREKLAEYKLLILNYCREICEICKTESAYRRLCLYCLKSVLLFRIFNHSEYSVNCINKALAELDKAFVLFPEAFELHQGISAVKANWEQIIL